MCECTCLMYIFNMEKNIFMQWCIIFNWLVVYIQSNKYLHRFSYKLNSILKASSFNVTVVMSSFSINKCSHSLKYVCSNYLNNCRCVNCKLCKQSLNSFSKRFNFFINAALDLCMHGKFNSFKHVTRLFITPYSSLSNL